MSDKQRVMCKYGQQCYRQNPQHFEEFDHPFDVNTRLTNKVDDSEKVRRSVGDGQSSSKKLKTSSDKTDENVFAMYLTKVNAIDRAFNEFMSIDIKDILSPTMGALIESAQFNYKFDIDWLVEQYPQPFRGLPLLVVYGDKRDGSATKEMRTQTQKYSFIKLCAAQLFDPFGTHHTKMMLLRYNNGIRVCISTANLVEYDWFQKSQGVWISPLFPPLSANKTDADLSQTSFKTDLIEYLNSYNAKEIDYWCNIIKRHDLSAAKVFLIASVPGRHIQEHKTKFGHLKLRKVLNSSFGPSFQNVNNKCPVVAQFSSIGSLGATPDAWLCSEFLASLASVYGGQTIVKPSLKLIFPTIDDVRMSLEGYSAGSSLPYSAKTAAKQTYLKSYLHCWRSELRGRTNASPHIKSYARFSPDFHQIFWFLLTSANLSRAAWGSLEKNASQLAIRSFELGVLFIPKIFGIQESFNVATNLSTTGNGQSDAYSFSLPYDIPLIPYNNMDKPWTWDEPHTEKPDRHGNAWIPSQ